MVKVELTDDIKRAIGQHFVLGFHGQTISQDIKTLITEYHLGNVILMKRNVVSAARVRRLTDELQRLALDSGHTQKLLIGTDQENGLVSAMTTKEGMTQL
jgi:beta-glucosidase-like glycosyl hydrolase